MPVIWDVTVIEMTGTNVVMWGGCCVTQDFYFDKLANENFWACQLTWYEMDINMFKAFFRLHFSSYIDIKSVV